MCYDQFTEDLMLGLGFSEIMVVLVLALIIIGPKKLPEVAKTMGKLYAQLKKAMDDLKESVDIDIDIDDYKPRKHSDLKDIYKNKWENAILKDNKSDDLKNKETVATPKESQEEENPL